jgi:excisionase family DNA binding protein
LRGKICRPGVASDAAEPCELPTEPLLSVKEVAARLGICRATAYRVCERGELPHIRVSNAIRSSHSDLAA